MSPASRPTTTRPLRCSGPLLFSASIDEQNSPRAYLLDASNLVSIDKGIGINYRPVSAGAANEKLNPDDSDHDKGPNMHIFLKALPGKWKHCLMGFTDSYEGDEFGSETPCVVWPREEYVRMWITCDEGLYMQRFGGVLDRVEIILKGLGKRQTRSVRAGAAKKEVDDMLEYAVR